MNLISTFIWYNHIQKGYSIHRIKILGQHYMFIARVFFFIHLFGRQCPSFVSAHLPLRLVPCTHSLIDWLKYCRYSIKHFFSILTTKHRVCVKGASKQISDPNNSTALVPPPPPPRGDSFIRGGGVGAKVLSTSTFPWDFQQKSTTEVQNEKKCVHPTPGYME